VAKEELAKQKQQNTQVNRVSFDLHPTIYRTVIKDNLSDKTSDNDGATEHKYLMYALWLGLIMNLTFGIFALPSCTMICQNLFQAMFTMAGTGIAAFTNFMVKNWLTYLQAAISGGIAGITAYKVYQSLPTDDVKERKPCRVCIQKGKNYLKCVHRLSKVHLTK